MLLALLLALSAAPAAAGAVKNPGTFVYLVQTGPQSFDPHWAFDAASSKVIGNVYEPLLTFKGPGVKAKDLAPLLAETVPTRENKLISADGRVYRFPIRKGVKFHDGTVMEPEDVRYSLLRYLLIDRAAGPSALLLHPILGLDSTRRDGKPIENLYELASKAVTLEDGRLVIRLHKPFSPFLSVLTSAGTVMPRRWAAARGQWDGRAETWMKHNDPAQQSALPNSESNGTGPYRIERAGTADVHFVRHDAYWRGPAPLERALLKVVPEFLTRRLMLQAGDADAVDAPVSVYSQVERLPDVRVSVVDVLASPVLLAFPFKLAAAGNPYIGSGRFDGAGVPPDFFADKDVRKGFAYSIDHETFIRDVLKGIGKPAGGAIPAGLVGHRPGAPRYSYDRRKAEEHFRKAWGGKAWETGFLFVLVCREGNTNDAALAQMLKKELAALNPKFRVDVRTLQFSTILDAVRQGKTPPRPAGWRMDFPDPHDIFFPIYHSRGHFAAQGYSNPAVDKLIDDAAVEPDPARRAKLYGKAQDLVDEDVPSVYIWAGPELRVMRSWIKGYRFRPTATSYYFHDLAK